MHERTHTSKRPLVSQLGQDGSAIESGLQTQPQAVHHQERAYECELCGECFTGAFILAQHQKDVHAPESPSLTCLQCGRGFVRKDNFDRHLSTHVGERPHACVKCGTQFARLDDMKKHKLVVHERHYLVHCPQCGKGLGNRRNLRKHFRAQHQGEGEEAGVQNDEGTDAGTQWQK
ncbi:zinc finger X-chromosomal protein-like [Haemaphysalis longicornis]